jgi:hypothetical protein
MSKFLILKSILKGLAVKIHTEKEEFKEYQRQHSGYAGPHYQTLWGLQSDYRHKHIAYSLLRGTPIEKIETKPKDPKRKIYVEPNMDIVRRIINEYTEENVCVNA